MGKRSIIYVDGFNLYFGAIRGTAHKWLDLQRYFEMVRKDDDIVKIRYFTARIAGEAAARQDAYLRALHTRPLVEVIEGKFKLRDRQCRVLACAHAGDRRYQVSEEKRTDVNIAIHMLDDAYQGRCERMVLVSGDSDLVPGLSMVRLRFPQIETVVYVPSRNAVRGAAVELRFSAHKHRTLPNELLQRAHLPTQVVDSTGAVTTKPVEW